MKCRIPALLLALLLLLPLACVPASAALVESGDYWTELTSSDILSLEEAVEDRVSGPFHLVSYSKQCGFSKTWVPQFRQYAEYNHIPVYGLDEITAGSLMIRGLYYSGTYPIVISYDGAGHFTVTDEVHSLEKFQSLVGGTLDESQGDYIIQMGEVVGYTGTDRDLVIPDGVKGIGERAFRGNMNIRSVVLPDSVTYIDDLAFAFCQRMSSITISASVTSIGKDAFCNCSARTIRFLGSKPDMPTGDDDPFAGMRAAAIYPADDPTWGSVEELRASHPDLNWGGLPGQAYHEPKYSDWNDGTVSPWAEEEVRMAWCYNLYAPFARKHYASPTDRETFCDIAMQTIEVCTGQSASIIADQAGDNPFTDTDSDEIHAAYALGLVTGRGGGLFDPKGTITRQEAATLLARVARYLELEAGDSLTFTDQASIASWAQDSVSYLSGLSSPVSGKAVMGGSNGAFMPNATYTLQESYCSFLRLTQAVMCV